MFEAIDRWPVQFGTSESDFVFSVAVDDAGVIYVVGDTDGSLGGPSVGSVDGFVRALDREGRELWTRQFGTSEYFVDGVAVDDAGVIYLAGKTDGSLSGQNAGYIDGFVQRIIPSD